MSNITDQVVWWVGLILFICGIALGVYGLWLGQKRGHIRAGGWLVGVAGALVGIAGTLVGIWFVKPQGFVMPEISDPSVSDAVDVCEVVTVSGDIPKGKDLAVATEEHGGNRIYFESDVSRSGDSWNVSVDLGDRGAPETAEDIHFNIYAVLIDEEMTSYLRDTNEEHDGWWSSTDWPPGAEYGEPVEAIGSGEAGECAEADTDGST